MQTKFILIFLIISTCFFAQNSNPIQADRPDQTETPATVPRGIFQLETGFTFQKNDHNSSTNTMPTVLWKYGVNNNVEIRLITEFVSETINTENQKGLTPIYFGLKVKITDENGITPKTSLIVHMGLPNAAASQYKTDFYAPEFRFVMQHTLSKKISLSYNLGAEWDGFSAEPIFIYTVATGYSISNKLGSYVEIFGFSPQKNKSNHSFDGGVTYLINENIMLDLSAGIGITKTAPDCYFAAGFSFRI